MRRVGVPLIAAGTQLEAACAVAEEVRPWAASRARAVFLCSLRVRAVPALLLAACVRPGAACVAAEEAPRWAVSGVRALRVFMALLLAAGLLSGVACAAGEEAQPWAASAGAATVVDDSRDAFSHVVPGVSAAQRSAFYVGNSFFNQNWVAAPASTAERDGLGPLFNARSCSGCHFKDGRGQPPAGDDALHSMLVRVSVVGAGAHGAPRPHPSYGDQIQGDALPGVSPEARVSIEYAEQRGLYADGEAYSLRVPRLNMRDLSHGPLGEDALVSARVAPALLGLGLLEAVPDVEIAARADPDDRDRDGVSGRVNRVWDVTAQRERMGRFGWKAEQPTLRQQTAAAFAGDLGITSELFAAQSCMPAQQDCVSMPEGGSPEIDDATLSSVARYVALLAVPARRALDGAALERGASLFRSARCGDCHTESLRTGELAELAELSHIVIHPYTDLLLHDMGTVLADGRPSFDASGSEFRTPPLWGVGLVPKVNGHNTLLHDGRARGVAEAVLWHAGEGEASKRAFIAMSRTDRTALVAYVEAL